MKYQPSLTNLIITKNKKNYKKKLNSFLFFAFFGFVCLFLLLLFSFFSTLFLSQNKELLTYSSSLLKAQWHVEPLRCVKL
jgi:hypothetical protein